MSHFKTARPTAIAPPKATKVLVWQLGLTIILSLFAALFFSLSNAGSVLLGGCISLAGQAFYNFRALRNFGSRFADRVVRSAYSAMYGKWAIIITASLICVRTIEELNIGLLYASLFLVHTLGALLLPLLVKRNGLRPNS